MRTRIIWLTAVLLTGFVGINASHAQENILDNGGFETGTMDPWTGFGSQAFTITEEWAEYNVTTPVMTEDVNPAGITFHIAYAPGDFWIDGVRFYEGDYVAP